MPQNNNDTSEGRLLNVQAYARLNLTPEWWETHLQRVESMQICEHEFTEDRKTKLIICANCGAVQEL